MGRQLGMIGEVGRGEEPRALAHGPLGLGVRAVHPGIDEAVRMVDPKPVVVRERLAHAVEIAVIVLQMIGVDVGDDRDDRIEQQE